jgi:paired amphipathic helix protein Sin3a
MCWDVLNDEWVSHPTSASEDAAPFIAHKKNIYEEALHRAEEERHEYDYHIEANLRTIQLLEPIAARIAVMSVEEKAVFRLKPGLGGQSKSIYQRIIKKIYGREGGLEVISALHDNPTIAVPVVLARLKQKDEEWKRAQREWNKVWREVDAKNFYKSLDHQGVTFKANDKKAIATKSLVAEIEALRREQNHRRETALDPSLAVKPKYQYSYRIDDVDCLADSLKMVLSYLDRGPGGMSLSERDRVETFLRTFIPTLFMFSKADFDAALGEIAEDGQGGFGGAEGGEDGEIDGMSETGEENGKGKKSAGDLRKKVLKGGVGSTTNGKGGRAGSATPSNASTSAAPSPAVGEAGPSNGANDWMNELTPIASDAAVATGEDVSSMDVDRVPVPSTSNVRGGGGEDGAEKTWINLDDFGGSEYGNSRASSPVGSAYGAEEGARPGGSRRSSRKANFFANTPLYVLIRLLQVRSTPSPPCALIRMLMTGRPSFLSPRCSTIASTPSKPSASPSPPTTPSLSTPSPSPSA